MKQGSTTAVLLAVLLAAFGAEAATPGRQLFETYCKLCHGASGEGDGPAANALAGGVRPANLRRSLLSAADRERIVRHGGAAVGRSASMPPWGEQLSDTEMRDLLSYLAELAAAAPRASPAP